MTMRGRVVMLIFALVVLALPSASSAAPSRQTESDPHAGATAIEVAVFFCPADYTGSDDIGDCDRAEGIDVTVSRDATEFGVSGATGNDGVVGFQGLGEGRYTIAVDLPAGVEVLTFCGAEGETGPCALVNPNTAKIGVELGGGEVLSCSFFVVPADGTTLPTTGIGARERGADVWWPGFTLLAVGALVIVGAVARRRAD